MKRVVSISLESSARDYLVTTTVLGRAVEIERIGTSGDTVRAAQLVRSFDGRVDAIGLGGMTPVLRVGDTRYPHREAIRVAAQARRTPVLDGGTARAILEPAAVARAVGHTPDLLRGRRVLITCGVERFALAVAIAEHAGDLRFADPVVQLGLARLPTPRSLQQLKLYAATTLPITALLPYRVLHPVASFRPGHESRAEALFAWADVVAGDCASICHFAPPSLAGKAVITDDPSPAEIADLRQRGVTTLVTMTPPLCAEQPFVGADVLEALVCAIQEGSGPPTTPEALEFVAAAGWSATVQELNARPRPNMAL